MTARLIRLAALGALATGCHAAARPPGPGRDAARTAVARPGQITERVLLTGALHPTRAIDVPVPASDATTLVVRWIAPEGTAVKAGDRLFVLDGAGLAGKLVDARRQLATAQAQLRVLLRNNAVELANRQLAVRDAEIGADKAHLRDGLPGDLVTRRDAEQARLRVTQTEAALQTSRRELASEIEQRTLDERLKRLELERSRRTALAAAGAIDAQVVRAPRDGMVLINPQPSGDGHKFRVGDQVSSGMPVVSLPDLSRPMEVRASLSDVDDGLVTLGMTGRCTLDAYPAEPVERSETGGGDPDGFAGGAGGKAPRGIERSETGGGDPDGFAGGAGGKAPRGIECSVEQLAPVARPSPGRDPLRRAFEVTLALAHGDPARLHPGMSVKVELDRPAVRGLIVPRDAVVPGAPARVRLGSGELREVALAGCDAQRCAVASGLTDGELVAGGAS